MCDCERVKGGWAGGGWTQTQTELLSDTAPPAFLVCSRSNSPGQVMWASPAASSTCPAPQSELHRLTERSQRGLGGVEAATSQQISTPLGVVNAAL